ncbi:MAG: hypothetical protein WCD86_12960 [Ktedonobacteraceae bacterium]
MEVAEAEEQHEERPLPLVRLAGHLAAAGTQERIPAGTLTHTLFGRTAQRLPVHLHQRSYAQKVPPAPQVHPQVGSLV